MFEPKKILIEGNPILRKKCKAVKKPYSQEDIDLALYLHEYVKCSTQEEYIEKYKDSPIPAIILIPGKTGSLGIGMKSVHSAVERAVGADILA